MYASVLEKKLARTIEIIDCPSCDIEMSPVQMSVYSAQHTCGGCGYVEER